MSAIFKATIYAQDNFPSLIKLEEIVKILFTGKKNDANFRSEFTKFDRKN